MQNIQVRIARLEQHVRHEATDGNRWGRGNGYNGAYGYNSYDRDRDGRDDRYENDARDTTATIKSERLEKGGAPMVVGAPFSSLASLLA